MNKRVFHLNSKQVKINAIQAVKEIMGVDDMDVTIEKHQDNQTDDQRAFFHVLVDMLAKSEGVSPEAMKMDIKRECWGSEIVTVRGHEFEVIKSSAKAKKDEYSELIECAYRIGAWLGHVLPNPRYNLGD
jgi:hypothetical protein